MSKVKSELVTDYHCANPDCDVLFDARRARLGYYLCMQCGETAAKHIAAKHHTILPLHKQGYMAFTGADAREVAKQINPKRTA
jgi:transposase